MNVVIMGHFLQRQHLPVTASTFGGAIMGFVPRCSWDKGAEGGAVQGYWVL